MLWSSFLWTIKVQPLFGSLLHDLITIIAGIDAFHCRFQKRLGFRPNQTPLRKASLHPSFLRDAGLPPCPALAGFLYRTTRIEVTFTYDFVSIPHQFDV
jgi:hypothetical protein